jgi:hypothetical protein
MGDRSGADRILVGRGKGKSPLGRRRNRWEDDIKRDLQEVVRGYDLDFSG